ncbi:hypothetical protein [Roseateles sp.]|uniref:hypothetical protein n=1 Tax=Roseateles sp. TaxID=1971397 RepID=UPI0025FDAED5|nr:hypothetical protein [Roseateles sp.]MBV8033938.1 hypothetical protein [Roseateles sp.]
MNESPHGAEPGWAELQSIRALTLVVCAGQAAGAVAGLLYPRYPHWFECLWHGAALATLPAFLVGMVVQARLRPGSLGENAALVRRFALISVLLSGVAIVAPLLGAH